VPITEGTFAGPRIRGCAPPGGAERQPMREDSMRRPDALHETQAEDGADGGPRAGAPVGRHQ
jgi:hypothetical protein